MSSNYQQVLQPSANTYGCNCSDRNSCPLGQKCKTPQVLYQAHVSNSFDNVNKFYYGLMETSLKKMQGNHKSSFRHEIFRNATELSKDVQKLHKPEKDLQQYGVLFIFSNFRKYIYNCIYIYKYLQINIFYIYIYAYSSPFILLRLNLGAFGGMVV